MISPRLQQAAVELAKLGVGAEAAMAVAEKLRRHADGAARAFVDFFVEEIWEPFDRAGRPEQEWPRIREALERMRPLADRAAARRSSRSRWARRPRRRASGR